ncbi:MAG: Gfo/Idh/MocA family oxidoreductase [Planctomycetota bacterium]
MKVRYAIISVGGWARGVHIPNLNQIANAEIAALCSRSEENLKAGLKLCKNAPKTYSDHRDMLRADDVDAVIVCSPNCLHAALSIEALEAGKHVLCEKPMALTVSDCDRVIETVERTGRLFQIGLELRYSDFFNEARQIIKEGKIGQPRMAWCAHHRGPTSKHKWRGQKEISGGPIFDVGVHYSDLFHFLLDSMPASVYATAAAFDNDGIWDCCEAVVTLANGAICNYRQTLISRHHLDTAIYVLGSEAYLHANMSRKQIVVFSTQDRDAQPVILDRPDKGPVYGFDGSLQQLRSFTDCILMGTPPVVGPEVGRITTSLCVAIEESIATGQHVTIE